MPSVIGLTQIKEAFELFDWDGSGAIDVEELKLAMQSLGIVMTPQEIVDTMQKVDKDANNTIEYPEFELMMMEVFESRDTKEEMKKAFSYFDLDKTGNITIENMVEVARQLGENPDDVRENLAEYISAASGGNDCMTCSQWVAVMETMKGK
eukprot:TRINITY_DN7984_c0_g1_i1.p1 TRINITY_DN7984_c0_g1~~TRINITY_DN7984_c0_g1_i1.p1  ORF type:complete len:151 (+),score=44.23 TRINITY_DN7984_c0_g1_i1:55-507(+)